MSGPTEAARLAYRHPEGVVNGRTEHRRAEGASLTHARLEEPEAVSPTDAQIIERSRDEPEIFARIFRRHASQLQRYITRRIGPDSAEDVLADVFLAAFASRHRYDVSRHDARPWLYGIATNLVGRHRRTEVRLLRAARRAGIDPVVAAFADRSDARVVAGAQSGRLAEALAGLRQNYRDALLLVAWAELTYEETASALNVPVGTVRSRVNRARKKLRVALGGVDPTAVREDPR